MGLVANPTTWQSGGECKRFLPCRRHRQAGPPHSPSLSPHPHCSWTAASPSLELGVHMAREGETRSRMHPLYLSPGRTADRSPSPQHSTSAWSWAVWDAVLVPTGPAPASPRRVVSQGAGASTASNACTPACRSPAGPLRAGGVKWPRPRPVALGSPLKGPRPRYPPSSSRGGVCGTWPRAGGQGGEGVRLSSARGGPSTPCTPSPKGQASWSRSAAQVRWGGRREEPDWGARRGDGPRSRAEVADAPSLCPQGPRNSKWRAGSVSS